MNATAAVSEKTKKIEDMAPVEELSAADQLAVAVEALTAIVAENDLTCMRALFRMRRRAEVALARIEAAASAPRH
ncbi:hypothetical protein GTA51_08990 [Desulfovibrio aerotolerans]|uniref:Uncharacterized protein n=1 Tax=Solidesulfovibrio aerotolerans TaxID=295255 RepID=A0A7C9IM12_9BACT|nr:hypothetical protein [Solidesulfovibrio aerotolerans]MYL83266.1 hypothetical protein [Solidesulfovibrio aerotolerans]